MAFVGVIMAGCGSSGTAAPQVSGDAAGATSTLTSAWTSASTTPPTAVTTVAASSTVPPPTTTATERPAATAAVTTAATPPELDRVGEARQAIVVSSAGYGSPTATLSTWRQADGGWERVHGPWPAFVGRAGFAPPGEKREGDGRTPSGTYGFEFAFGVQPDPGVTLAYRHITGPTFVWVDDPSSPLYNRLVDTAVQDPGGHGEAMFQTPAYDYGAVVAYNTDRTPGLGSAIFLHVSAGAPTAGCVSLPADRLLEVLRWLDPAGAPVIVMGVA
jgi:L,D-peptidoglycan transpeptidase YkuD (ErfK/YbiS/YcfS/YnhG family)